MDASAKTLLQQKVKVDPALSHAETELYRVTPGSPLHDDSSPDPLRSLLRTPVGLCNLTALFFRAYFGDDDDGDNDDESIKTRRRTRGQR